MKEVKLFCNYSGRGKTFWITDKGENFSYGYDSRNSHVAPQTGTNWTGEDGNYRPFHWYLPNAKIITMRITTDDQGSVNMQVLIDLMNMVKYIIGEVHNWLTSHNWWAHGWSSTNGQLTSTGMEDKKIIINSNNTKGEKMARKFMV